MKASKLKRLTIVILTLAISFWLCVEIVNRNSKNMTIRQKVLKVVYPFLTGYNKMVGKNAKILKNESNVQPLESIYDLSVRLNDGKQLSLRNLKGRKVLFVNTASDCGYTSQYVELQKLYQQNKEKMVIIGFPANDFRNQERKSDSEIEKFCSLNFGVSFPLAAKSVVIRSVAQNEVFRWLTDKTKNGWNDQQPTWNFSKYLVNEQGVLVNYFDPAISPVSEAVTQTLNR